MAGRSRPRTCPAGSAPYLINLRAFQTARFSLYPLEHEVTRLQPLHVIKSRICGEIRHFCYPPLQTHLRRREQIDGLGERTPGRR